MTPLRPPPPMPPVRRCPPDPVKGMTFRDTSDGALCDGVVTRVDWGSCQAILTVPQGEGFKNIRVTYSVNGWRQNTKEHNEQG